MDNGSDLSQRILRAAQRLFFARGYANTQLRAIATEAGTSESGILRVFHSKRGLLCAVYGSCWADINDHVDEAMAAAVERDADPRNLLVELTRTVLEFYEADPLRMTFLCGHFGFRETTGLGQPDGVDSDIDAQVRTEYHRYLRRIRELCAEVVDLHSRFAQSGVGANVLGEFVTSIIYGIQTSWYMADEEPGMAEPTVTIEEVLATMRMFLYLDDADGPVESPGRDHATRHR